MSKIINREFISQIEFSSSGNATIEIDKEKVFIHKTNTLNSLHLDTVSVEKFKRNGKTEAKVIKVVSRFKTKYVGKVHKNEKSTFVIADSNKIVTDFYIKGGLVAKNGQKVLVELTKWKKTKSPQAKIVKILGDSGENNAEINSIMYEYNLPIDFNEEVKVESDRIPDKIENSDITNRKDLRNLVTFTIDPDSAKDFDDALSVNIVNENRIEVGVHIADVSHYVKEESIIDKEALERGTSIYLVDRVIPMLPERLSNGICSLVPNEDRLAFSVIFTLNKNGDITKEWHGKTIIHSDKRFTYEEAQSIIEGSSDKYENEVKILNSLAKKIRNKRMGNGSIEINGSEIKFKLDKKTKKPIGVYSKIQKDSNKLIEEFMLLANKSVARLLSDSNRCNIYRVHDEPSLEKLYQLKYICEDFGYNLEISKDIKSSLNTLLKDIEGKPEENMIETLVTRSMSKAKYTIQNNGHYGLGFTHYSHFTSPIRRYPDLITHRILGDFLNKKPKLNPIKIEEIAKWCSSREIVASKAQRDSIKYKQVEYLSDKIGQIFKGVISSVTDWGIYVELVESKCDGLIKYQSLEDSWSINVPKQYISNGEVVIKLGDLVKVKVEDVNLDKKQIGFTLYGTDS